MPDEVKLRAERKAGELLQQLERSNGGRPAENSFQPGMSFSEYRTVLTESNVATTTAQRWQTVAAEILPMLEDEAKERQGARTDLTLLNSLSNVATERNDSTAAAQAANIFNTNRQYVADAKRLMSEAPDLAQHVKAGDMKITEARRQLQQRQKQEAPPR